MQNLEVVDQICTTGTGGGQHAVDRPQLGKVFETFFAQACTVAKVSETVERLAAFEASHFILRQTQYGVEGQSDPPRALGGVLCFGYRSKGPSGGGFVAVYGTVCISHALAS